MVRFVRSDSVVSRVITDETLIVPIRRGVGDLSSIYSLNPVASAIWNAIAEPRTEPEIVQSIREEFEETPETAGADVEAFLAEMASAGLVNVAEAGVAA
jgi:coenzyme PQQ synthesis protein D (PqqD)